MDVFEILDASRLNCIARILSCVTCGGRGHEFSFFWRLFSDALQQENVELRDFRRTLRFRLELLDTAVSSWGERNMVGFLPLLA